MQEMVLHGTYRAVLLSAGCCSTASDEAAYKQRKSVSHSSGGWESGCHRGQVLMRTLLRTADRDFSFCPHIGKKARELSRAPSIRALIPLVTLLPHDLITSQHSSPHTIILGFEFQHMHLEGTQTSSLLLVLSREQPNG